MTERRPGDAIQVTGAILSSPTFPGDPSLSTSTATDPRPDEPAAGSELTRRRLGCSGTLLSSGCGCLAFMSGAALAIALFGAHLLSGWGARALEELLASGLNATVEVSGLDLSWSRRQTVQSVTVVGPDGQQVAQASAELPSLLDMLNGGDPTLDVSVDVLSLRSRVDEGGVDDLQRTMQIGEQGLLETALRSLARWGAGTSPLPDVRVSLSVKDWTVDDTASGRGLVRVRDSEATIVCRMEAAALILDRALVTWPGRAEPAEVSGAVHLGPAAPVADRSPVTVQRLALSSDGVPLDVARSMGLIRRTPPEKRGPSPTPEAWMHGQAVDFLMAELEAGAVIDVDVGPDPGGEQLLGRFEVSGPSMTLSLDVEWEGGLMVPRSSGSRAALDVLVRGAAGGVAGLLEGALPERLSVQELSGPRDWTLASRSFSVPFEPRDVLNLRSALVEAMGSMQLGAYARVAGGREAQVRLQAEVAPDLELSLAHFLTNIAFDGERGSTVTSSWRDGSSRIANLSLRTPSAGGANASPGEMQVAAFDVPTVMLGGDRQLPREIQALLPERLSSIALEGLALPRFGDWEPTGTGEQVRLNVVAGGGNEFYGFVEGSILSLPFAHLETSPDAAISRTLFERLMPWFTAVRPQPGAAPKLELDVVEYTVDLAAAEFRETGQMTLAIGSMLARLQSGLAGSTFNVPQTEWVEWGPDKVRLELNDDIVRYRRAQIPLGEDEEPVQLSGFLDRGDNVLSIKAVVPANVVVGAEDAGILPAQLTLTGPADRLDLAVDRDVIAPLIDAIRGGE